VRDREVEARIRRDDGPEVVTLFDRVNVDRSILRPGNCQVEINGESHTGDGLVMAAQDLNGPQGDDR